MDAFERVIVDFLRLVRSDPGAIAHDLHPDYASTRWALEPRPAPASRICRSSTTTPTWRPAWPRTGSPGLRWASSGTARATGRTARSGAASSCWATLRASARGASAPVPPARRRRRGARAAARGASPCCGNSWARRRSTRDDLAPVRALTEQERGVLAQMLRRDFRSPVTTSAGRLFDGVAALVGLHQTVTFEGQAAMALEYAADPDEQAAYPLPLNRRGPHRARLGAAARRAARGRARRRIHGYHVGAFPQYAGGGERCGRQSDRRIAGRPQRGLLPESAA